VPAVVHRNFKSANVLLDDELNPFLTDCGIAALTPLGSDRQVCISFSFCLGEVTFFAVKLYFKFPLEEIAFTDMYIRCRPNSRRLAYVEHAQFIHFFTKIPFRSRSINVR